MKLDENVSENALAGVEAGENTDLLNNSKLNKMSTTKNLTRKMLIFGAAFFMVVSMGKAQEKTVKSADATKSVSAGKEVKPVIPVAAKLFKAMDAAKNVGGKTVDVSKDVKYSASGKFVDYYWFRITANYAFNGTILPPDAEFINYGPEPDDTDGCLGGPNLCIGGFTVGQVNTVTLQLNGPQVAAEQSIRRGTL